RIIPFRVQCLYKDDTLWVLAQHPAEVSVDIPDTFSVLERALQAEEPKTPLAVKLYLRTEGDRRPYSQQGFTVYPLVNKTVPGEAAPAMTGMREDRIALDRDRPHLENGNPIQLSADSPDNDSIPSTIPEVVPSDREPISAVSRHDRADYSDRLVTIDADAFVADIEHSFANGDASSTYPPAATKRHKLLMPLLGGLGLLALGTGAGYMGTRPCVFSVCTELNTATQLTKSSLAALKNPTATGQEVLTAQKQLHQSVDALGTIPAWSGSYGSAQNALQATLPATAELDTTVAAMNQAYKATTLVKTPPITLLKWQQSKQMWMESISSLSTIPTTSQVYPLARQKLTDYQERLVDVDKQIGMETTAEQKLKSAMEGIKAAKLAQTTAKSLTEWQGVKTQWDTVSSQLGSIPATTIAYTPAQAVLKSAQPQIFAAQEKFIEEDKADRNYQNAVKLAESAKLAQKNNQLPQAVAQWNQSVVAIQSIPKTSAMYPQAQPLALEYTKSFQQVENQLKDAQKIALATRDLQRTCAGSPQICTYTVSNKSIVVRLMSLYTQTVKQTAMAAASQGDGNAKAGILNHVNTLGNALQAIGDNAKLPIEVYGADGQQIQSYLPQ
ncbi:hypothetical protein, partial [Chamaesiphon sp. OTE_20_metabat_361]|uniref:hypothetical protein n=1 Tax=Chamaesiphon sp. OTE_20_metabat_361 TaxID=2964689 RepID=UPI00286A6A31